MKLIAKKPCSFGGRKFFIDQDIPVELVAEPGVQERLGVLTVIDDTVASGGEATAILDTEAFDGFDGKVIVPVVNKENGDAAEMMSIPLTEEQVQSVFSIMQMNIPDAEKAVGEVTEENVLIVLHACDTRAKVRKAAKNRADTLIPNETETDAPEGSNEATGHTPEADNQLTD